MTLLGEHDSLRNLTGSLGFAMLARADLRLRTSTGPAPQARSLEQLVRLLDRGAGLLGEPPVVLAGPDSPVVTNSAHGQVHVVIAMSDGHPWQLVDAERLYELKRDCSPLGVVHEAIGGRGPKRAVPDRSSDAIAIGSGRGPVEVLRPHHAVARTHGAGRASDDSAAGATLVSVLVVPAGPVQIPSQAGR